MIEFRSKCLDSIDSYVKLNFPKYKRVKTSCIHFPKHSTFKYLKLWLRHPSKMYRLYSKVKFMDKVANDILDIRYYRTTVVVPIKRLYSVPETCPPFLKELRQREIFHINKRVKRNNEKILRDLKLIASYYTSKKYLVHLSKIVSPKDTLEIDCWMVLHMYSKYFHVYPYQECLDNNYSTYAKES